MSRTDTTDCTESGCHAIIVSARFEHLCWLQCVSEDTRLRNHVWMFRCTATDLQHLPLHLSAGSAIADGVLGADMPRLWQCDISQHGKHSPGQTAISGECCCTVHITPLLRDLHWLYVPQLIEFKLAVLVFCCQHHMALSYLTHELRCVADMDSRRRLPSASTVELDIPPIRRFTFSDRTFRVAAACL